MVILFWAIIWKQSEIKVFFEKMTSARSSNYMNISNCNTLWLSLISANDEPMEDEDEIKSEVGNEEDQNGKVKIISKSFSNRWKVFF